MLYNTLTSCNEPSERECIIITIILIKNRTLFWQSSVRQYSPAVSITASCGSL